MTRRRRRLEKPWRDRSEIAAREQVRRARRDALRREPIISSPPQISLDRDDLEETQAEWLAVVAERLLDFKQMGVTVRPVDIDVDELARWCRQHQRLVDGAARSEFTAAKLAEEGQEGARDSATSV